MKRARILLLSLLLIAIGVSAVDLSAQAGILDFFYKTKDVLTVAGNQVLLNGNKILLSGVAVGDPHSRLTNDQRTIDDYEVISKEWKANVVRLSVHPGVWRRDEKRGKSMLEEEVKAARDNGLFVIIDWHVIGNPNGWYKPCPWGEYHYYSYSSNFNIAKDFWKYIALEYRSDRGVMFELWNEPADDKDQKWEYIQDYMQRLTDIIKSNGAENIIIGPGVWWTYDLRGVKNKPLSGDNIAYAWHNYPTNNSRYISWDLAMDDLYKYYPIFVTEWGYTEEPGNMYYSNVDNYSENLKKYLLEKGLHFTAWCWHATWKPTMFKANWVDLNEYGGFVKKLLADIENGWAYLNLEETKPLDCDTQKRITDFIKNGVDKNSIYIGEGERKAVVFSFQQAFGRLPESDTDHEDIKLIANGHWPSQRSTVAEAKAQNTFRYIYKRESNMDYPCDNAAITVMAYGLRQRAENRNLESEERGLIIFKSLYNHLPDSTEDWNILQAITYSGASR